MDRTLTKQQYKTKFGELRKQYHEAIFSEGSFNDPEKAKRIAKAWKVINSNGFRPIFIKSVTHVIYPISLRPWAVSHNHKGY